MNMGPFYVLVRNGIVGDKGDSSITLYRNDGIGPHFFSNARKHGQSVHYATVHVLPEIIQEPTDTALAREGREGGE